jgi:predicted nuclease of predicted toxin-antitoxin system
VSLAILLHENMPRYVTDGLRGAGHDVATVAATNPATDDRGVLAIARSAKRWLLTLAADFGDLIFQRGAASPPAVLYFRLHPIVAADVLTLALESLDEAHAGHFCVVTRQGIRRRPLPAASTDAGA